MEAKTLQELEQQIADAKLAIAKLEVVPLQAINDEIAKLDFAALTEAITSNLGNLTNQRREQAQNILTVLNHCPAFLSEEANRLDQMINPPEPAVPGTPVFPPLAPALAVVQETTDPETQTADEPIQD